MCSRMNAKLIECQQGKKLNLQIKLTVLITFGFQPFLQEDILTVMVLNQLQSMALSQTLVSILPN